MWTDPHAAFDHVLNPYVSIPLLLVILLLAAPFVVCGLRLAGLPDIGEPFDLVAAGTVEIGPADNAFTGYKLAHALFVPGDPDAPDLDPEQGWTGVPEREREWLHANRSALAQFQTASQASDALLVQPHACSSKTFPTVADLAPELRNFSRLSELEALRQLELNDTAGAWQTLLAAYRSSRHCGKHGILVERLVGIALHSRSANAMLRWSRHSGLTATQLRATLHDVRCADELTVPNHEVVQAEYFYFCSALHDPAEVYAAVVGMPVSKLAKLGNFGLYLLGEPELSRRLGQHMYANALSQCDRPFANRTRFDGLFEPDPALPEEGRTLRSPDMQLCNYRISCAAMLGTPLGMLLPGVDRERVRQAVLELGLALQAYHREHAEFPAGLTELIPADLPRLPDDPFAPPGTSLKYRREGGRATLWSIGPDGIDDDGRVVSAYGSESGDIPTEILAPGEFPSR